jgi:hypothetical protein
MLDFFQRSFDTCNLEQGSLGNGTWSVLQLKQQFTLTIISIKNISKSRTFSKKLEIIEFVEHKIFFQLRLSIL